MSATFTFQLGDRVVITESGEAGQVIARAEYLTCDPRYLVRYTNAQGCATEQWWDESALISA